jgi:hypothetical protein
MVIAGDALVLGGVHPQRGLQFPIVRMASSTSLLRTRRVRVATTSPTQPHARAFALSWSNSAWVIVPASRSCLADAI